MSIAEALISGVIIVATVAVSVSAAARTGTTQSVEAPEVVIHWQNRMIHNSLNNPVVELVPKDEMVVYDKEPTAIEDLDTSPDLVE